MDQIERSHGSTWRPVLTGNTTVSSYWINWRVLLCSIWMILSMIGASLLIWKYEVPRSGSGMKHQLCNADAWRTCLKEVHPAWLLFYRIFALIILLTLLVVNILVEGGGIFFYYTQWTFLLIIVYFTLGSMLSAYGCCWLFSRVGNESTVQAMLDMEQNTYIAPNAGTFSIEKGSTAQEGCRTPEMEQKIVTNKDGGHQEQQLMCYPADIWCYIFQIIYQICGGAVMLTDAVFWLIFFPFLAVKDYKLNFLLVGMHSINMVFLLGDAGLNCLKFPWFRFAYFTLWTATYVIFQWIIHACVATWWPYPFLDLSSRNAPAWYLVVGFLQIPCYAIFAGLIKLKDRILSRWLPRSYQCLL